MNDKWPYNLIYSLIYIILIHVKKIVFSKATGGAANNTNNSTLSASSSTGGNSVSNNNSNLSKYANIVRDNYKYYVCHTNLIFIEISKKRPVVFTLYINKYIPWICSLMIFPINLWILSTSYRKMINRCCGMIANLC